LDWRSTKREEEEMIEDERMVIKREVERMCEGKGKR
jgi:hypothetical protein